MKDLKLLTLSPLSNIIGSSNDETNFPHKLLLTKTQVSKLRQVFANILLADIKLSKNRLHELKQPGRFLGRHLGPLVKIAFPLIGIVLKPLAKRILKPLGLTVVASAKDATIHIEISRSGFTI